MTQTALSNDTDTAQHFAPTGLLDPDFISANDAFAEAISPDNTYWTGEGKKFIESATAAYLILQGMENATPFRRLVATTEPGRPNRFIIGKWLEAQQAIHLARMKPEMSVQTLLGETLSMVLSARPTELPEATIAYLDKLQVWLERYLKSSTLIQSPIASWSTHALTCA